MTIMARQDEITKKKKRVANNVSHSNRKTKRTQNINLQTKRFFIAEENRWVKLKVTTRSMRSIAKMGILAFAKKHAFSL
jgi:large subunit ribosomal protein L28